MARTVGSNASCHSHSLENATHLAGTGVQVLIYMGQMQPASSSIWWSVDARCDSHTDFHLQQKIEYKSGFHGNDYKKLEESGIFSLGSIRYSGVQLNIGVLACSWGLKVVTSDFKKFCVTISCHDLSKIFVSQWMCIYIYSFWLLFFAYMFLIKNGNQCFMFFNSQTLQVQVQTCFLSWKNNSSVQNAHLHL